MIGPGRGGVTPVTMIVALADACWPLGNVNVPVIVKV
jgi:hypothetical protein